MVTVKAASEALIVAVLLVGLGFSADRLTCVFDQRVYPCVDFDTLDRKLLEFHRGEG